MLKLLFLSVLAVSCSTHSNHPHKVKDDLVSVKVALDQAQMSYLKGCVDAFNSVKITPVYEKCRDQAILHRKELDQIMGVEDLSSSEE